MSAGKTVAIIALGVVVGQCLFCGGWFYLTDLRKERDQRVDARFESLGLKPAKGGEPSGTLIYELKNGATKPEQACRISAGGRVEVGVGRYADPCQTPSGERLLIEPEKSPHRYWVPLGTP